MCFWTCFHACSCKYLKMYISENLYINEFVCICTLRWWIDMLSRYRHRCCRRCLFSSRFFFVMLDFDLISNFLSSSRFSVFSCALENVLLALAFTVIHYTNMLPSMMFCILGDVMDGTKTGHERLRYRLPTMIFECSDVFPFVSRLW